MLLASLCTWQALYKYSTPVCCWAHIACFSHLVLVDCGGVQVERLQHKFSLIHSTLAQQATLQAAPAGVKQSDLTERLSLMSLSDSVRWGDGRGRQGLVECLVTGSHACC